MNRICKILSMTIMVFLITAVAGCIQPDSTAVPEPGEETASDEQSILYLQKESTMMMVNEAIALMGEKGELAFEDFREKDSKWYHNDTYLSIWTNEGIRVVFAPNVSSEGESVIGLKDYSGKRLDELFIGTAMSEEAEGWVSYQWPRPGQTSPALKHTFVRKASIGNQTYVVTSGFYVDDYVYTNDLVTIEDQHFTRFGDVSLANFLHPATVDRDLGVDYSIAHVVIGPGASIEPHVMTNPEAYYVLAGEGVIYIEDVPFELSEGKLVLVPANSKQHTENTGGVDLEYFAIDQPAWSEENERMVE